MRHGLAGEGWQCPIPYFTFVVICYMRFAFVTVMFQNEGKELWTVPFMLLLQETKGFCRLGEFGLRCDCASESAKWERPHSYVELS